MVIYICICIYVYVVCLPLGSSLAAGATAVQPGHGGWLLSARRQMGRSADAWQRGSVFENWAVVGVIAAVVAVVAAVVVVVALSIP